jgi:hypothetical protein
VTGQVDGPAVHWTAKLGEGAYLFGVGTLYWESGACQGAGGGFFSGPQPGDSGDWSGQWTGEGSQAPTNQAAGEGVWLPVFLLLLVGGVFGGVVMFLSRGRRAPKPSAAGGAGASARRVIPAPWPGETSKPIQQYVTTYQFGDDRYDLSFTLNTAQGFQGEYGVGISETLGKDKPLRVSALDVWMFDKDDIHTVTKVLLPEHGFGDPAARGRAEGRGEAALPKVGSELVLETRRLRLRAQVLAVTYGAGGPAANSYFAKITLKLAAWVKT